MFERELNQGVTAVEVEFGAHAGAVIFDGAVVDAEVVGDFLAGFVIGDEAQDAAFGGT